MTLMFMHMIALNRTSGRATAFHFASNDMSEIKNEKEKLLTTVSNGTSKTSLSFQMIPTNSADYESVVAYNPYFKQFDITEDLQSFRESIHITQSLSSVDVASFLERRFHTSSFTLQKVLYFIYADFLTEYGTAPFRAEFVAFDKGPVDFESYKIRKWHRESMCKDYAFEEKVLGGDSSQRLLKLIDKVVRKYAPKFKEMNDEESNLTHRTGTPWSIAHKKGYNASITDDMILKYHSNEQI